MTEADGYPLRHQVSAGRAVWRDRGDQGSDHPPRREVPDADGVTEENP